MLADRAEKGARGLLALEDRMDVAGQPRLAFRYASTDEASELPQAVAHEVVVVLAARVAGDAAARSGRVAAVRTRVDAVRASIVIAVADADHAPRVSQQSTHIARIRRALGDPRHLPMLPVGDPALERLAVRGRRRACHSDECETEPMRLGLDRVAKGVRIVGSLHRVSPQNFTGSV